MLFGEKDGLCNGRTCLHVPSEFILAEGRHPAFASRALPHCINVFIHMTGNWPTLNRVFVSYGKFYSSMTGRFYSRKELNAFLYKLPVKTLF